MGDAKTSDQVYNARLNGVFDLAFFLLPTDSVLCRAKRAGFIIS